ncbi:hypothetical protein WMY93_028924 [Mugilogobius chulae]|uniref:Uncharacterized protein n=1 Tax=Mugilogobius chulae TaxID=88201 RepID=A0AAW0MRM8_9GOBI
MSCCFSACKVSPQENNMSQEQHGGDQSWPAASQQNESLPPPALESQRTGRVVSPSSSLAPVVADPRHIAEPQRGNSACVSPQVTTEETRKLLVELKELAPDKKLHKCVQQVFEDYQQNPLIPDGIDHLNKLITEIISTIKTLKPQELQESSYSFSLPSVNISNRLPSLWSKRPVSFLWSLLKHVDDAIRNIPGDANGKNMILVSGFEVVKMSHWTLTSLLLFTLPLLCSCSRQFLIVSPNVMRADSQENVFLQANGVSGMTIKVTIRFKDYNTDDSLIEQYTSLTEANKYHTLASVRLPSGNFLREDNRNIYVFMTVTFETVKNNIVEVLYNEKKAILVSFQSGYIFIQTDKPIYKPGEIVLPAFRVTVTPTKQYLEVDDTELNVEVTASYLFGETVNATAYVIYGLRDGQESRRAPNVKQVDMVDTTYHDGSPAYNVPLTITVRGSQHTRSSGIVSINMPNELSRQRINIKTNEDGLPSDRQASIDVTVEPYKPLNTGSANYLYIHDVRQVALGQVPGVELSIKSDQRHSIQEISYLILTKGKILEGKRVPVIGQQVTSVPVTITPEMIPTFRFVAFYLLGTEVVSDSLKVEVSNSCVKPPTIVGPDPARSPFQPGKTINLEIRGEPSAKVSLVAVDQAVYLLRKNRFTQRHILNEIDSRDFGCTQGSGENAMGVFRDAGLLFAMLNGPSTSTRQDLKCPNTARRRRSAVQMAHQTQLLGNFQEKTLQRCCRDGLRGVLMPYSCEQRSLYITEGPECIRAFLKCCNIYKKIVFTQTPDDEDMGRNTESGLSSDVSNPDDNNDLGALGIDDSSIQHTREQFEDTWLWRDELLPNQGPNGVAMKSIAAVLPDSLTEWSVLAVSSSLKTGFCVGNPWTFVVNTPFFVDLKLPYSVARYEQVEIKAVVYYNNQNDNNALNVLVALEKTSKMCSLAFTKEHVQRIKVWPGSSAVVRYSIVPFEAGKIPIAVKVRGGNWYSDRVIKTLNVVVEGVQTAVHETIELKPAEHQGRQVVRTIKPIVRGQVLRSVARTELKLSGAVLAESIQNAIRDDPLAKLILKPGGCVEQNLAAITFPVIASTYLDLTNSWETVDTQRKVDAHEYITKGYYNQLNYRQGDGSYPPYLGRGPSTWVTAYVVKIFTMAYSLFSTKNELEDIISIDEICLPVSFLIKHKQSADGSFTEENPVSNRYMTGGLRGSNSAATLTAFVTIALAEVREKNIDCSHFGANIRTALNKAGPYLNRELRRSPAPNPYTKAIVSYALASITFEDFNPTDILVAASSADSPGELYWRDDDPAAKLEGTGYALLALLKKEKMTEAQKAFEYLKNHRYLGDTSFNTQSTMVTLQAMAEYLIKQPPPVQRNLDVSLLIGARRDSLNFNSRTNYQLRSFNVRKKETFEVVAVGNGEGTLEVVTYYNQLPKDNALSCEGFDMQVSVNKSEEEPQGDTIKVFTLNINVTSRGPDPARSTVLDITIPTGFTVHNEDLENMVNGVEKYIDHFYFDDKLSERSSLIVHMYEVSNERPHILTFRLLQKFNVGFIQPSSVTVYQYYEGPRCTQLYSPPQDQNMLSTICRNHVCQCVHDDCCAIKNDTGTFPNKTRETFACETLHHVYKVKVVSVSNDFYTEYEMEIIRVINFGLDATVVESERRLFFTSLSCRNKCKLQNNSEYLIIGPERDVWTKDDNTNKFTYVLGADTWVERWPTEAECKTAAFNAKCKSLTTAANYLHDTGCRAKK